MNGGRLISERVRRAVGRALWVVGATAIAVATLSPVETLPSLDTSSPFCLVCGELGGVDALLNTLLFIPLGAGLAMAGVRFGWAMPAICVATFLIESLQFTIISGRDASLGDLLTNAIGGAVGYFVGTHFDTITRPTRRASLRLLCGWLCIWVAVQAVASYALRPNPIRSWYFGQIAPELGDTPPFSGQILDATLDGHRVPDGLFANSAQAHAALSRSAGAELRVALVPRQRPAEPTAIVRIADHRRREILSLNAHESDITYGVRTGADVLRLRPMFVALRGALAGDRTRDAAFSPDTTRIVARFGVAHASLTATGGGRDFALGVDLTVGKGWRAFSPTNVYLDGSGLQLGLDATWMLAWLVPAGFWAAAAVGPEASRRGRWTVGGIVTAALCAGFAFAPAAVGSARVAPVEVLASLAGLAIGAATWRLAQPNTADSAT